MKPGRSQRRSILHRLPSGGREPRSGAHRVFAEDGPYLERLHQGIGSGDDLYQLAVCADVAQNAQVAAYAVVLGDGTTLVGSITGGQPISGVGALLIGLGHGLAEFGDHTSVSLSLLTDEPELLPALTAALLPGWPSRSKTRQLRELAPNRQLADEVGAHLRRLRATPVRPPAARGFDDLVPQHPLLAPAFRIAWYARHLASTRHRLEDAVGWLTAVAALNDSIEEMRRRLTRLASLASLDGTTR